MPNSGQLAETYPLIRQQSLALSAPLELEDYSAQPIEDVSPPKWHLAHSSWFFETFLLIPAGFAPFDPAFGYLFNSYYEGAGPRVQRARRGDLTRPMLAQVLAYREHVDAAMAQFLAQAPSEQLSALIELGLHHEQQHQELLLTDIKYILGHNPLRPVYQRDLPVPPLVDRLADTVWLELPPGRYEIGHAGPGFCFDNEMARHSVWINPCQIASQVVSNQEYLEFIQDQGYQRFEFWLADGWAMIQQQQIQAPLYWQEIDGQWHHYTLQGLRPLDLKAPVSHISYYEADAYAAWRGCRLPSEQEWEVAATLFEPDPPADAVFMEQGGFQPRPQHGPGFWGNVWQWTQSAYLPYPGFAKQAGTVGEYNGKFMCGQMVLRGGSCATPRAHVRLSYRNFFQPDKRWQFSGLRLAQSLI
ncbi:MAG: ergothioneine biosynthesis protein EgtB [Candidatus Melainabacteria bacterium HGW-Melainabacteria-1]|nr:MAG: ergothioneine biosynthesis protein EgtB [Candidatus Melainabacteria bacterium HGW-Melainabacteria-1]